MIEYKIEPGDTLGKIARKFYGEAGLFTLIVSANEIANPDDLPVGETLLIPDREASAAGAQSGPAPPYGEIADLLKAGQVVPFLGAGVNIGQRPPQAAWAEGTVEFLPTGAELSRFLARKSNFPSTDDHDLSDLAKVSSYFVETTARRRLRDRLREVFAIPEDRAVAQRPVVDRRGEPCSIHKYLAGIGAPLLIVTTNYDDLMERSLTKAGKPYYLVVHLTDHKAQDASVLLWEPGANKPEAIPPNELVLNLERATVVYKMHGTVNRLNKWASYVITEEDYVDFLSRMTSYTAVPMQFMRYFRERHFLFLGYGLRDWNLRVILKNLRDILPSNTKISSASSGEGEAETQQVEEQQDTEEEPDLRSWAIQFRPSDFERELWNARKVKIYDQDLDEFVRRLQLSS